MGMFEHTLGFAAVAAETAILGTNYSCSFRPIEPFLLGYSRASKILSR